ncbi:MAG: glycine zipper family protein [Gallionella sp.]
MNSRWYRGAAYSSALLISAGLLAGCATQRPIGPTVSVMPAPGKPFDVFTAEDQQCRQYASQAVGLPPGGSYGNFASSAAAGTAIGAVAGELIGGNRQGASVGAGMGFLAGSSAGANQTEYASRDAQWRYNNAYKQCMYAKGNQVPGYQYQQQVTPPPPNFPPPPPSGQ